MQNITNIGAELWIYENPMLENIEALENITPESIVDLHIYCNPMLSECDLSNICEYLLDPAGTVEIYNNAPGCNNQQQVMDSCDVIPAVHEMVQEESFTLSPNPASNNIVIISPPGKKITSMELMDAHGRVQWHQTVSNSNASIDVDRFSQGLYLVKINTGTGIRVKKLIIN